ncbi:SDR family NAD(P)-dependent oxidoreductase [Thiomicrospira sp. R3]|uniref:SDR family NAD(P)-dependent oxidoreductase n=1 Tax=Thiomicrospira sp. R3 TaxID=3035472 RepID=UPI00259AF018|nr:SDR family NAD(P)-dependent oxidoreductase [Thiomicrospira sp. R3]WFE67786.1 SDR family NAD(P)-dependent oxidoreductase [Thiomicrospira sp. R3]
MKNLYKTATPLKIWLVGGSQGIGLELTKHWLTEGHSVIVSARQAESSAELTVLSKRYANLKCLNLDVTDQQDCQLKVNQAWSMFDGIDLWFYNVGAYQPMKVAQWQWQDFVKMNQANYLGAVALMLALQPLFAHQGQGRWVWNTSLASYFGLPYGGGYSAPKAALVNLAESLQPELAEHKIQLQIINHGFVKTRLTAKNDFSMPGLVEPAQAAALINKGLQSKRFEIRFPFGLRLFLSALKIMPYTWALGLTRRMLKP